VDDAVMGGESSSTFNLNDDGFGVLKAVYHLRTMEVFFCALSIPKNTGKGIHVYCYQTSRIVKNINLELNQFRRLLFLHSPVFYLRRMARNKIPLKRCIPRLEEEN
jgi:hypothetical protein